MGVTRSPRECCRARGWVGGRVWLQPLLSNGLSVRLFNTVNKDKSCGGGCSGRATPVWNEHRTELAHVWALRSKHVCSHWWSFFFFLSRSSKIILASETKNSVICFEQTAAAAKLPYFNFFQSSQSAPGYVLGAVCWKGVFALESRVRAPRGE